MAWPCKLRAGALITTLGLSLLPGLATAAKGDEAPAADAEDAPKAGKKSREPAGPKVTVLDGGELRADASDIGKVLKKLRKKEKLEFVERSADNKWAKVRKGKVEGWVLVEQLEGVPPPPGPDPAQVAAAAAAAEAAAAKAKAEAAPPPPPPVVVAPEPVAVKPPPPPPPPEPVATVDDRPPLSGVWIGVGGGVALLNSSMDATTQSGLVPELFNYKVSNLLALGMQANLGYTFAYKMLRIGVDAGYRFAGATSIVVQLPDRDSLPTQTNGVTTTTVLKTPRQQLPTSGHDADAAVSIGAYIGLPKRLDLSLRARAGFQMFGFLPEFNNATALPQEVFYGPHVGAVIEFGSRFVPGFGLRLNGGYIPYAVRQQNTGLRDGTQDTSTGYFFGASASARIVRGLDVELAYRMLSTTTSYQAGSNPERLKYDRDVTIRGRYMTELLADGAVRGTGQQTITLGLVFLRH